MKFELFEDLPLSTKQEIERVLSIPAGKRNSAESDFLTARLVYLTNEAISYDAERLITVAAGVTVPTEYEGFKKGALFIEKDADTNGLFVNIGDEASAEWEQAFLLPGVPEEVEDLPTLLTALANLGLIIDVSEE